MQEILRQQIEEKQARKQKEDEKRRAIEEKERQELEMFQHKDKIARSPPKAYVRPV
jgi:hypothetical protein